MLMSWSEIGFVFIELIPKDSLSQTYAPKDTQRFKFGFEF
jgi:hypothetical protein